MKAISRIKGYTTRGCFSLNPHLGNIEIYRKYLPFSLAFTEKCWSFRLMKRGLSPGIYDPHNYIFITHLGDERKADKF